MTRIVLGVITLAVIATTLFVAFVLLGESHTQAEGFALALTLALVSQVACGFSLVFVFSRERTSGGMWVWSILPFLCGLWALMGLGALLIFPAVPLAVLWSLHVFGGLGLIICVGVVTLGAAHVNAVMADENATAPQYKNLERAVAAAKNAVEDGDWSGDLAQRVRTALNKAGATPRGRVTSAPGYFQAVVEAVESLKTALDAGNSDENTSNVETAATQVVRSVDALLAE